MLELNIAGLKTRFVPERKPSGSGPDSLIILLHGYGAAGDDLVYLSEELDLPGGTALVFPEGPLKLGEPTAGPPARGWWPTDSKQFHLAMLTGQPARASNAAGLGRQAARALFDAFIRESQSRFCVTPRQVVLGGFSQGSILCLDWALHNGASWAGLLCLSGTWIEGRDWDTCLANAHQQRVLISHGRYDPILPFSLAQELQLRLRQAAWDVEFVPFNGSHAIPSEVIRATSRAVTRWLGAAPDSRTESRSEPCPCRAASSELESNHRSSS